MLSSLAGTTDSVKLVARRPDGSEIVAVLTPSDNLLVGASSRCRLQLDDPTISPIHCLLRLVDGQLHIQQWSTESGTRINGDEINGEGIAPRGAKIELGAFLIEYDFIGDNDGGPSVESPERTNQTSSLEPEPVALESSSPETEGVDLARDEEDQSPAPETDWSARETEQPDEPSEPLTDSGSTASPDSGSGESINGESINGESVPVASLASRIQPSNSWQDSGSAEPADSFDQETIEMLCAEVEELQTDVALKDARIADLLEGTSQVSDDCLSVAESRKLVQRLEGLLDETERADERTHLIEDMLQAAEEANQAEQEERCQLEAWVTEIEQRIGARESEWKAELATLEHRVQVVLEERNQVEQRLQQVALSPESAQAETDGLLDQLRGQNDLLEAKLEAAGKTHTEMEKQIAQLQSQRNTSGQQSAVDDAVREERAHLALERATVTRMRSEITSKLADTESSSTGGQKAQEIEA